MTVRFLEIAEIELDQAVHWYGAQAPGLGNAFLIEVLSAADRIARFPEAWHLLSEGVRRCRLSRFPYGLIVVSRASKLNSAPWTGARADKHRGAAQNVSVGTNDGFHASTCAGCKSCGPPTAVTRPASSRTTEVARRRSSPALWLT